MTHQVAGLAYNGYIIMLSNYGVIYEGGYSVNGSSISGIVDMYDGTYVGTANLSGTVSSQSSINGSFETNYGSSGTVSLSYEAIYERTVTTSDLSGGWSSTTGGVSTNISFDSNGALSGYDNTGCLYEGTAEVIEPGKNLFRLNVDATHCADTSVNGSYTGYAALLDDSTWNDTLQYTLRDSSYIIIDYLER